MDGFIESFLSGKGYTVNNKALSVIHACDDWYANRFIKDFHKRSTVQGTCAKSLKLTQELMRSNRNLLSPYLIRMNLKHYIGNNWKRPRQQGQ